MQNKKQSNSNEYLKTKVLTASPEELQLMLYDGAIRFCEQARQALLDKEIEKSFHLLTRAESIIMEMCTAMREDIAPETCAKMRGLYIFCYEKLVTANMKKDIDALDEALKVIRHMRETWTMLIEKLKAEQSQKHHSNENNDSETTDTHSTSPDKTEFSPLDAIGSHISVQG